jgi:FkbM family methyltransferase
MGKKTGVLSRARGAAARLKPGGHSGAQPQPDPTPAFDDSGRTDDVGVLTWLQVYRGYEAGDLDVFDPFRNVPRSPEEGFIVNFLGVRTRAESLAEGQRDMAGQVLDIPVPCDYHAEAVEYVGLLKTVLSAEGSYSIMELGAGWGPFLVDAGAAARLLGITDIHMMGVESDPGHMESMRQHLLDNGFNPDEHRMVEGAVGASAGTALFPRVEDHANQWGARPAVLADGGVADADRAYLGSLLDDSIEVEVFDVCDLLREREHWDCVHVDIQGAEVEVLRAAMPELLARARFVIIGTHSRKIDGDLVDLFHRAGWLLEHEKPAKFAFIAGSDSLEAMTTVDGAQVWRNPAFRSLRTGTSGTA